MDKTDFVHLHLHTDFSLLDGAIRIKPLAKRAQETGARAVAITDHGNLYGAISFYNTMKYTGVKPIVGIEAYIAKGKMTDRAEPTTGERGTNHLILLAKNFKGYQNLIKLSSYSFTDGFYYKPRIDKDFLAAHSEGLVGLSACLSGVPSSLLLTDKFDEAARRAQEFEDIFGKGSYYLEVQNHQLEEEVGTVIPGMMELSRKTGIPLVATNDCHYLMREDWKAHDIHVCIGAGKVHTETRRIKYKEQQFYFRTPEEMQMIFADLPEAILNTVRIAEMCDLELPFGQNHLPEYRIPEGFTTDTYFAKIARDGLAERWAAIKDKPDRKCDYDDYRARLEREIETIMNMGFPGYFLIVWDFIRYAKKSSIPVGPGRGSAAGSLVAYAMRITDIDPLQYDLLFERFLNPERVSMPDIDIDFCVHGRQKVIDYVTDYYGRDRVSMIATFGTMASKAAIKDVGRALDLPYAEVDKIAKMIPPPVRGRNVAIEQAIKDVPELKRAMETDERVKNVLEIAMRLEGCSRHTSVHAAGVVISPRPLYELVPISKTSRDEITTQYPMADLEKTGMLKMDFLALTTLTIIEDCLKSIKRETGAELDLANIPLDDKESLQIFADGKCDAIFQFESDGMKDLCRRLKPEGLEDLSALNALYRPGPIDSGMVDDFIDRRHGKKKIRYDFAELKDVLSNTMGVCVSGDTLVFDAVSGKRLRVDELENRVGSFYVQSVDRDLKPRLARVTHFFNNGEREVVHMKLRNGASVKVTPDHQVLTEEGWREVRELKPGDYVATPRSLMVADEKDFDLRKLRVLAYLLADGSLGSAACCDFVSKDESLLKEYRECLKAFDRVASRTLQQVRGVTRVLAYGVEKGTYHEPNSLLAFLRELGLKTKKGGCRSAEKFVPDFVFGLRRKQIAFFLASLWDCDGHIGMKLCHYKTISRQLAEDVQTLLLRLGIHSTIYESRYHSSRREGATTAYQVTVYNLNAFADLVSPYLVAKAMAPPRGTCAESKDTVSRQLFMKELSSVWGGSAKRLQREYGLDRQHLLPKSSSTERISASVVRTVAERLPLTKTRDNLNVRWEKIIALEPAGVEAVYDITVEGTHNFVGNNIVLHNCVYQEQIMAIFQRLAGYSLGEADLVRRAMGKKKREELDKHREKFTKQAVERGHEKEKLDKLWQMMEGFADYAFNRAHSFAYGYLAYQTAYLKAHYATHFWAAVLSNELNNTSKVVKYIQEARLQGIAILPPDINESIDTFTASGKTIRFGLVAIKGIGQTAVASMIEARNSGGPFKSIFDFAERVDSKAVNKRVMESLVKSGALDSVNTGHRAQLFAAIDAAVESGQRAQKSKATGQVSLFGAAIAEAAMPEPPLPNVQKWTPQEQLKGEKETLGFYISGHPLQGYEAALQDIANADVDKLASFHNGAIVAVGGIILDLSVRTTKKGDRFAMFQLEDQYGSVRIVCWPEAYRKAASALENDAPVLVRGRLEIEDGGAMTIYPEEVQSLINIRERAAKVMSMRFPVAAVADDRLDKLYHLLDTHRGDCEIVFEVELEDGQLARIQPNQFVKVKVTPELTNSITELMGRGCRVELRVGRASSVAAS